MAEQADYIFLGVKPYLVAGLMEEIGPVLAARKDRFVLVSMAAALTIPDLRKRGCGDYPLIRIMPNTPSAIGEGVIFYTCDGVTAEEEALFLENMAGAGRLLPLDDHLMDAGSAVAGCGPAFVDLFIEAMADGGVACGLPRDKAMTYAAQTLMGAAELVLESGSHPGALKDAVCSPGGSTIQGVRALEMGGFRSTAMEAVLAAYASGFPFDLVHAGATVFFLLVLANPMMEKIQRIQIKYGLLEPEERARIQGLVINKFRGDSTILDPGIQMLTERGQVPVLGTVPYMELTLEDEDSLTDRFDAKHVGKIDLAVIHYPRISNFTDFDVFEQMQEVSVRYVTNVRELGTPDLIFLPGSKNTMGDLKWMRQNGLEAAVKRAAGKVPIFGICGGYQMLGYEIADPDSVEEGGRIRGMELLPVRTVLQKEKHRCQTDGKLDAVEGIFSGLTGCKFAGYEIHMGQTVYCDGDGSDAKGTVDKAARPANSAESNRSAFCADDATRNTEITQAVIADSTGRIYGSYIHGLFDMGEIAGRMIQTLAREKGISLENGVWEDYRTIKERQYDKLADTLREYLRMEEIYGMLREARIL